MKTYLIVIAIAATTVACSKFESSVSPSSTKAVTAQDERHVDPGNGCRVDGRLGYVDHDQEPAYCHPYRMYPGVPYYPNCNTPYEYLGVNYGKNGGVYYVCQPNPTPGALCGEGDPFFPSCLIPQP
jgi:hypothetical protein